MPTPPERHAPADAEPASLPSPEDASGAFLRPTLSAPPTLKARSSLVYKLLAAIAVVAVIVIGAETWWWSNTGDRFFVEQLDLEQRRVADVAATAIKRIWAAEGWEAALAYLEEVERSLDGEADVRWVWLDKPREDYAPVVALELLTPLVDGEEDLTTFDLRGQGRPLRVLYRPVALAGLPMGAVEVSRSTVPLDALITSRRRFQYAVAGTLVLLLVLAASVFSRWLVSRPMEALLDSLRRIGEGDLSHRTGIDRRDEIGALAAGIDQMVEAMDRTVDAARLERRLRRSAERHLQTADRMLTVATVQNAYLHDIATPLGIVMGHANLLELQPDLNDELKGTAKSIREQVARVDMLVKRLRAAGDRRTVDGTADVQLTETIYEVAEFLRPLAAKRRVTIVLSLEGAAGERGDLDPLSFSQVLQNLLVNAVQASDAGSEITVTTSADTSSVQVAVRDQGSGIPEEVRHRIFEPYFTTKEEGVGTGLGLYMSRRLVGRRSGSLELVTTSTEGTVFRVTLRRSAKPR